MALSFLVGNRFLALWHSSVRAHRHQISHAAGDELQNQNRHSDVCLSVVHTVRILYGPKTMQPSKVVPCVHSMICSSRVWERCLIEPLPIKQVYVQNKTPSGRLSCTESRAEMSLRFNTCSQCQSEHSTYVDPQRRVLLSDEHSCSVIESEPPMQDVRGYFPLRYP